MRTTRATPNVQTSDMLSTVVSDEQGSRLRGNTEMVTGREASSSAEIELGKLKSFLIALDEQDTILIEEAKRKRAEVSMPQSRVIKRLFDDIRTYTPDL